jgi:hypothetical protein
MPAHILEKPATVEDVAREVSKIRSIVTDAVEDGVRSARQAFKHGRHAAEDLLEDAQPPVHQSPLHAPRQAAAPGDSAPPSCPG